MRLLSDPKVFNYAIMALFGAASIRWGFAGSWQSCVYWAASFALTVAVTFH
jgi:hypothetical protein